MLASITKRDGTEVPFDSVKILNAITKANQAVGGEDRVEPVLGPRPVDIEFDRGRRVRQRCLVPPRRNARQVVRTVAALPCQPRHRGGEMHRVLAGAAADLQHAARGAQVALQHFQDRPLVALARRREGFGHEA